MFESIFPGWFMNIIYAGCAVIGACITGLYIFQEKLIYVPQIPGTIKGYEHSPNQARLRYRDIYLDTADGLRLHGWLMWDHRSSLEDIHQAPTILFFQANAGNISHRLPFFAAMISALRCSVIAISYRGYGPNEGSPTEAGLKIDAETLLEFCQSFPQIDKNRIFLFGRSLGGAVAIDLAAKHKDEIAGLIVENTFLSISDLAPVLFPLLKPFVGPNGIGNFLLRNKWENKKAIKTLTDLPVLFLASGKDEMVPPEQMKKLYDLCASPKCQFSSLESAGHMDAYDQLPVQYWSEIRSFIEATEKKA